MVKNEEFMEILESFQIRNNRSKPNQDLLFWIFNSYLSVEECFEKIKNHIEYLKENKDTDFRTDFFVILKHMIKINERPVEESFYDLIIREREKDEGLEEAEKHQLDPPEPKQYEEKVSYREGPSGWTANIFKEKEGTYQPNGIFKKKIESSEKFGRKRGSPSSKKKGIKLRNAYALVRCNRRESKSEYPCPGLMIVSRGQKTKQCPRCGRTIHLASDKTSIMSQSNERRELVEKMARLRWKMMNY